MQKLPAKKFLTTVIIGFSTQESTSIYTCKAPLFKPILQFDFAHKKSVLGGEIGRYMSFSKGKEQELIKIMCFLPEMSK